MWIGIGIVLVLPALVGGGWFLGSQLLWEGGCRQSGWGMMGGNYGSLWGMHTWSGGFAMFLFGALIIGGVILLVVALARQSGPPAGTEREESPLEVLKWRYAAGEIDRTEYEMMKEVLSG